MRQRARFAIDERLEKHVIGYARDSRGPPVMAAPTAGGAFYDGLRRNSSSNSSRSCGAAGLYSG